VNVGSTSPVSGLKFLCNFSEFSKVHKDYRSFLISTQRTGVHQLWVSHLVVPTDSDINVVLDQSDQELAGCGEAFTYFGPLFGAAPFTHGRYVFSFGDPSDFRSWCTTMKGFYLMGAELKDEELTLTQETLVRVSSLDKWHAAVIQANTTKTSYFLRPRKFFSTISNLLCAPRKGVIFSVEGDQVTYRTTGSAAEWVVDQSDSYEEDYEDGDEDELGGQSAPKPFVTTSGKQGTVPPDGADSSEEHSEDTSEETSEGETSSEGGGQVEQQSEEEKEKEKREDVKAPYVVRRVNFAGTTQKSAWGAPVEAKPPRTGPIPILKKGVAAGAPSSTASTQTAQEKRLHEALEKEVEKNMAQAKAEEEHPPPMQRGLRSKAGGKKPVDPDLQVVDPTAW